MKPKGRVSFAKQPAHRTIGKNEKNADLEMTTEPWECCWDYKGLFRRLIVPAGYTWDGASIPRFAWSIIGLTPGCLMDGPSLAHDAPYRAAGGKKPDKWMGCRLENQNGNVVIIDRAEADWVLLEAAKFAGVVPARAGVAYGVVRAFGGLHWGGKAP